MTRRWFAPVVLGLLMVGALATYAVTRVWLSSTSTMTAERSAVTGQDAAPVLLALAVVVAAGGLAVVASGGWLRQLIGLVIASVSMLAAITAYRVDVGGLALAGASAVHGRPWRLVTTLAFAVAAGLGAIVVVGSRGWPRMSSRFAAAGGETGPVDDDPADQTALWKAFDDGRDPTA